MAGSSEFCMVLIWQAGNFLHFISRFIVGFAIGFSRIWQISLVTLAIVPFIAIAGGLYAYVSFGLIAQVQKAYVRAGEIAQEVFSQNPSSKFCISLIFHAQILKLNCVK